MARIYGLLCEMLPDQDGKKKLVMGHETYTTAHDAITAQTKCCYQNLPFSAYVVEFDDPREQE